MSSAVYRVRLTRILCAIGVIMNSQPTSIMLILTSVGSAIAAILVAVVVGGGEGAFSLLPKVTTTTTTN